MSPGKKTKCIRRRSSATRRHSPCGLHHRLLQPQTKKGINRTLARVPNNVLFPASRCNCIPLVCLFRLLWDLPGFFVFLGRCFLPLLLVLKLTTTLARKDLGFPIATFCIPASSFCMKPFSFNLFKNA